MEGLPRCTKCKTQTGATKVGKGEDETGRKQNERWEGLGEGDEEED